MRIVMSDIKPFLKENRIQQIKDTAQSRSDYLQSLVSKPEPNHLIEPELLRRSCVSDSTKMIEYLDPKLQEGQSVFERQVEAIEKIANEAKNQSISSSEIATEAKKQSESSNQIANIAKKQASKADWNSCIAVFISFIALTLEIILNRQALLVFFQDVLTSLQSVLQTI